METEQPFVQMEMQPSYLNCFQKVKLCNENLNTFTASMTPQDNEQCYDVDGSNDKIVEKSKYVTGCANKLCKSYNQINKEQRTQISIETLCMRCQEQFQKDSYCIYCKQIYFDETDDGKEWIMCEECSRWVHSSCADFNTKQNPNALFQCIKCKKVDAPPAGRRHIPRAGYAKLEKKKNSQFLNSLGFDWELTTFQISEDMENIRKYLG